MAHRNPQSYIRAHRRRSGLTQRELAGVLGYTEAQVSRHERARALPPLVTALVYEALFRVPVAELFPHAYQKVKGDIETRLTEMEQALQKKSAKGRAANMIARKLEWLSERRNQIGA